MAPTKLYPLEPAACCLMTNAGHSIPDDPSGLACLSSTLLHFNWISYNKTPYSVDTMVTQQSSVKTLPCTPAGSSPLFVIGPSEKMTSKAKWFPTEVALPYKASKEKQSLNETGKGLRCDKRTPSFRAEFYLFAVWLLICFIFLWQHLQIFYLYVLSFPLSRYTMQYHGETCLCCA